jgi:Ran GTPase-activating protein (RanGAP) involved in mRNA processing and transport
MAALASTLVANKTISVLLLGDNLIGDAGARALAGALSQNVGLRELNMAANGLGAEGAASLFASLQQNKHLAIYRSNNSPVTQATVAPPRQASLLNVALTTLQLCFCDMSDTDVMHLCLALGQHTVVRELNVSHNKLTHLGGEVLGKILKTNTTFKTLKLRGNKIGSVGSEAIFAGLAHNSCLQHLDISDNGVRPLTGAALKSNTALVSLKLSDNPHLDFDRGLATLLMTNTTLLDIDLKNTASDDTRVVSFNMAVSHRPSGAPPVTIDLRGTGAGLYVPTCGLHASLHLVCAVSRD